MRSSGDRTRVLVVLGGLITICTVGFALYANSFPVPFLFDDEENILKNTDIRTLRPLWTYLVQSRGVLMLTLALNYRWGELNVWGYHLVNVTVHVVNGFLLYALVWRTLCLPFFGERYRRTAPWLALIVALGFVAHPLATMAVTYIIQRAESLAALFVLATLLVFIHGSSTAGRVRRVISYALTIATCYLAGLVKETAVAAPPLLLLYDWCFLSGDKARSLRGRWLVHVLLFATVLAPMGRSWYLLKPAEPKVQAASALPKSGPSSPVLTTEEERILTTLHLSEDYPASAGFAVTVVTPFHYLLTQFGVIAWYLRLYVLPTRLCFDYGWPYADSPWRADVLLPFCLLSALALIGVLSFRRYRLATFCIGWFFLALAPSSSIIPILDAANDYRMYLAVAPITFVIVVAAADIARSLAARSAPAFAYGAALSIAGVWLIGLGYLTITRNRVYQDRTSLAIDSIRTAPDNWRPYYDLGTARMAEKLYDEAETAFKNAIRLNPKAHGPSRIHLGEIYIRTRKYDQAIEALRTATESPDRSAVGAAYRGIGLIAQERRQWSEAAKNLRLAARLMPEWSFVRKNLGIVYVGEKRWEDAASEFEAAAAITPTLAPQMLPLAATCHHNRAVELLTGGDRQQACPLLEKALEYNPQLAEAYPYLALCHAEAERWDDAEKALLDAIRLNPSDRRAPENLERVRRREKPGLPGMG